MKYSKRIIAVGIIQAFISGFFAVFVETLSSNKQQILIIGYCFSDYINTSIIAHPVLVISILASISILLYIFSHLSLVKKNEKLMYNRMCQYIFIEVIKRNIDIENKNCKVSFLKVRNKRIWSELFNLRLGKIIFLEVYGRHQTKQGSSASRVKFFAGEGVAGLAYSLNTMIHKSIRPFNAKKEGNYYDDCEKILKLPKDKAIKLNDKASSFICVPITFFGTDEVIGIISVDSMVDTELNGGHVREIEKIARAYTTIFSLN